jgi:hypothetical protein
MPVVMQMTMMIPLPIDNLHRGLNARKTSTHRAALEKIHSPRLKPWVRSNHKKPGAQHAHHEIELPIP